MQGKRTRLAALVAALCLCVAWSGPGVAWAKGQYQVIEDQLNHSFSQGEHTPRWHQTLRSNNHPVGCGNTAWAIALAYYDAFKGLNNLFPGNVADHYGQDQAYLKPLMEEIAGYTETTYPEWQGKRYGRTLGNNMCQALKYARKRGYHTRCFRIRGSEFDKAHHALAWIRQDKPGILLINDPKKAFTTLHYPVVEGVRIKQKKVAGKWRDRDVDYLVNLGGAEKSQWVNVRQFGRDTRKRHGSFSLYLFDVSKTKLPDAHGDINLALCQDWCAKKSSCVKCSKHAGCGRGYDPIKTWRDAGKNYYACAKRKSRSQASADNKAACEEWCRNNSQCKKCSRKPGCGIGYKTIKSWTGRGKNYYACKKR